MIIAVIPAKRHSNRLADKNLLEIDGISLVAHAIRYARRFKSVDEIFVSTDSEEVARIAGRNGARVHFRGPELGGEAPLVEVYRDVAKKLGREKISFLVGVQPDHPNRKSDLDTLIGYVRDNRIDDLRTADRHGKQNGALRIMSKRALMTTPPFCTSIARDDCINIHSSFDFAMAAHEMSPYSKEIVVGDKMIGTGNPTFVIAEAACNHMCDVGMAKEILDLAAEAGADAVKFQTYKAERLTRKGAMTYWRGKQIPQIEYYRKLDRFGAPEYESLFAHGREKGVITFSTPFDIQSAEMLNGLGAPLFKIASCDLPDSRLLKRVAGFGKPVILSTGGSTVEEIECAVTTFFAAGNHQLILMACMLSYPVKNEDANLLRIHSLKAKFPGLIVGLSDHTEPDEHMVIPSLGVVLGAKVIEKHFTLDRNMSGSGHFFSMNPEDLKKMVRNVRLVESVLGDGALGVAEAENAARSNARRSIVAEREIQRGEIIESSMLGMKRPADGLPGWMMDELLGKRAKTKIQADQALAMDMVE
ncbi:MAG: N-acetylneuraminate synthase family protein [Nitrospinae bacterium]|nr:N-acetylneuraminate synthase family protein [Nitrospinota bacterium]